MTHQPITIVITLFATIFLLNSCDNSSKAPSAAPQTEAHSQHSMAMMQTMDAMMQRTNALKMTGDFDMDFANMMIEHHQGAIDMSEIQLKSGADPQIKGMAQKIITAQKNEIAQLRNFVQAHPTKVAHQQQMHGGSMQTMHQQMKSMPMSGKLDHDFASMMMTHHQGAVAMAQEEVAKGQHTEIKQMAQQMINDQQREIAEFQAWLDKNRK